jgi:NAD(P)-dependent dehydrogenase (short-subunit alcohol dehydrogenase family)
MFLKKRNVYYGATAIVTGGASGIGLAIARELAGMGCEVVIADIQGDLARKAAAEISRGPRKVAAVKVDVTDHEAVANLVRDTVKRTGRLDFMFNNAGIAIGGDASRYTIKDWNSIIDINLYGVINGIQAAYPQMIRQGRGHIINTASIAGLMPSTGMIGYTTTKHAIVGLSKALRAESSSKGIRVSVLCPGAVRTPILTGGRYGKVLFKASETKILQMWERLKPISPEVLARKALAAIGRNQAVIIIPSWWKLVWVIDKISTSLSIFIWKKIFHEMKDNLDAVNI